MKTRISITLLILSFLFFWSFCVEAAILRPENVDSETVYTWEEFVNNGGYYQADVDGGEGVYKMPGDTETSIVFEVILDSDEEISSDGSIVKKTEQSTVLTDTDTSTAASSQNNSSANTNTESVDGGNGLVVCGNRNNGQADCDKMSQLYQMINDLVKWIITISSSVFAIMVMYAGFNYLTAMGDEGKIKKGHEFLKNAIIGYVIMLSAWLVIKFILDQLGVGPMFSLLGNIK